MGGSEMARGGQSWTLIITSGEMCEALSVFHHMCERTL
jgi:hypothetical protein